jgi:hypothetical protein
VLSNPQAANLSPNLQDLCGHHQQLGTLMDTINFYVALYDETTDRYLPMSLTRSRPPRYSPIDCEA